MLIIHDARLPENLIQTLQLLGDCIAFTGTGITYDAIAGHPDIFFCQINNKLVIAPNTPKEYVQVLQAYKIDFQFGLTPVGELKHNSTAYNAVVTDTYMIHNRNFTDKTILNRQGDRKYIHVKQGYTRCSLLPLADDSFLTSDEGIAAVLSKNKLNYCYVKPEGILLKGFKNGFIGGCMGVYGKQLFVYGSLDYFPEGEKVTAFLHKLGYEIIELYKGPLIDGGSLMIL
jgi:hypothetical protein